MSQKIKIMILGGARENGKNMYAVQVEDEIFIMDAGLKYPDSSLLGIDVVIPDLDFFRDYGAVTYGDTIPFKLSNWLKMSLTDGRVALKNSKTEQIPVVNQ